MKEGINMSSEIEVGKSFNPIREVWDGAVTGEEVVTIIKIKGDTIYYSPSVFGGGEDEQPWDTNQNGWLTWFVPVSEVMKIGGVYKSKVTGKELIVSYFDFGKSKAYLGYNEFPYVSVRFFDELEKEFGVLPPVDVEPASKFKKGDKVRLLESSRGLLLRATPDWLPKGFPHFLKESDFEVEYEVKDSKDVNGDVIIVSDTGRTVYVLPEFLELVESESPKLEKLAKRFIVPHVDESLVDSFVEWNRKRSSSMSPVVVDWSPVSGNIVATKVEGMVSEEKLVRAGEWLGMDVDKLISLAKNLI